LYGDFLKAGKLDETELEELGQRCKPLGLRFIDILAEAHSELGSIPGTVSAERESSPDKLDEPIEAHALQGAQVV
jgi:hypothetical protein